MRKIINTVLAGALGLSMIAGVSAQSLTGDASINIQVDEDGEFTAYITDAPDFGTVDYSVTSTTVTTNIEAGTEGDLEIEVTYARGDAAGWVVYISGEDFTNNDNETPRGFTVSNLTLGSSGVAASPGTVGSIRTLSPHPMTTGQAPLITGLEEVGSNGIFTITYTGNQLIIPAGQPVDEYTSTLEVDTVAAP